MSRYVVTVTREVPVEAPDLLTAEAWALEEEHLYPPVIVEVIPDLKGNQRKCPT
jgi:hypothetical protein